MDRIRSRNLPIAQKYLNILQVLCLLDDAQRLALLRKADSKLVTYLCECALNILRGNVPLTSKKSKSKLRQQAPLLRKLATPSSSSSVKKKLLIKSVHLLPLILKPVLSIWSTQKK